MPHCLLMSQFYLVVAGIHTTPCLPLLQSYFVVVVGLHDSKFKRKQFTMTQCYPHFNVTDASILLCNDGGNPWLKVKMQRVLHDSMLPTLQCYQYLNACLHLMLLTPHYLFVVLGIYASLFKCRKVTFGVMFMTPDRESVRWEFEYDNFCFWKEKPSLISLILNSK